MPLVTHVMSVLGDYDCYYIDIFLHI